MAKNYSAELLISTAKARSEMRDMRGQVDSLNTSLTSLSKTLRTNQGDLDAAAKAIGGIVASSQQAAKASEQLANAKIKSSRADAQAAKASDQSAVAQARVAQSAAAAGASLALKANREEQGARASTNYASAQERVARSTDTMGNSLSNSRYLLYDVGATYRTLALGLNALPAASLAVATAYEKDFAQVIRTTGETGAASEQLRGELKTLATEIPLSFSQLSEIAKIGGQMDIPAAQLGKFTEVVAKFVATADGVSIESATESFGRLANLFNTDANGNMADPNFFQRIGSAISYTADRSVTSEKAISAMLTKIGAVGRQAGMSVQEVTAFASALSSVGLAPEISSGFMTRFFGSLNKAVAGGTEGMAGYAKALGVTTDEFENLVRNDPNKLLTNMLETMQGMDSVQQTSFLGNMGIKATRDQRVVQMLASQLHVLKDAQEDVNSAFNSGSYLDSSSAGIFTTFAASLQKLASAFMNLGDTMGRQLLPILTPIVEGLTGLVSGFDNLLTKVPALRGAVGVLMSLSTVAGTFFALKAAASFLTAGLIGFQHATQTGISKTLGLNAQVRRLAETLLASRGASQAQTTALLANATGVKALGVAYQTSATQIAAAKGATFSTITATKSLGATAKGAGAALLGLAGGPIGVAVTAIGALGLGFWQASEKAKTAAGDIATAFQQSADSGVAALSESLVKTKVGMFDTGATFRTMGDSMIDVSKRLGISGEDIAKAAGGGADGIANLRDRIAELKSSDQFTLFADGASKDVSALDSYLKNLETQMGDNALVAQTAEEANRGMGAGAEKAGEQVDGAATDVDDYTKSINDAIAAAFGMVDAQGQVQASLEKLGTGVQKTTSFGTDSSGGRDNLASLQAALAAQALLLQQQIQANEITAQAASQSYAGYVESLMSTLVSKGVDPTQIQALAQDALAGVQGEFNSQIPPAIPVTVETEQAVADVTDVFTNLYNWLQTNTLSANMDLVGADQATQDAYNAVSYIAQVTGMPFEAVMTAFTDPASSEAAQVGTYMQNVMGMDYKAIVNADTAPAVTNVQKFATWAQNLLSSIGGIISTVGSAAQNIPGLGGVGNAAAGIGQAISGWGNVFAGVANAPASQMAQSVGKLPPAFKTAGVAARTSGKQMAQAMKAPKADLGGINRGYRDAAKNAGGAGKAAKGAGKSNDGLAKAAKGAGNAAKKAGKAGKKAGDDAAKGAQKAKKDWDAAEQAISGYASRVGNAFQYVFDKTQGVSVAKDEYYSVLNGIKDRLEQQKQTLRDLRAENKSLNAERKKELIDADKLEQMAKLASKHGNPTRAKDYRAEAAEIKASAKEKDNKIKSNEKEIRTIEKGTGNLKGYSQAAIENRKELRSLEQAGLGVAEAYAKSGASAKTVKNATIEWTQKAKDHSKQLGYNRTDIGKVTTSTDAYIKKLAKVPKTVSSNIKQNTTKTTTYKAKNLASAGVKSAKRTLGSVPTSRVPKISAKNNTGSGVRAAQRELAKVKSKTVGITITGIKGTTLRKTGNKVANGQPVYRVYSNGRPTNKELFNKGGRVGRPMGFASGGKIPGNSPANPSIDNLTAAVDGLGQVRVRSGEFIQSEPAVKHYGEDFMNKVNQMKLPKFASGGMPGGSRGGSGSGGVQLVDLTADTIQAIARASDRVVALYADIELLASSVDKGKQKIAQKGGTLGF